MASRRVQGELTESPAYALVVSVQGGKVWLKTAEHGPVSLSFWMEPEQARELGFALLGASEMANDNRALQQQVQRPTPETLAAMGELGERL